MEDDKSYRRTDGSQGEAYERAGLWPSAGASQLMAEDTALQLFQIAALMLGTSKRQFPW